MKNSAVEHWRTFTTSHFNAMKELLQLETTRAAGVGGAEKHTDVPAGACRGQYSLFPQHRFQP